MKNNPIQFAVVREDSQIEMKIVSDFGFERATLIGSGGCTAFCLKAVQPQIGEKTFQFVKVYAIKKLSPKILSAA